MACVPIPEDKLHDYGELPEISGNSSIYEITDSNTPSTARESFVYLWPQPSAKVSLILITIESPLRQMGSSFLINA